jgi:glycosyltransferase involved in cell wall biosynthesis
MMRRRGPVSIAVVVPSYRRPELLERCLKSLSAQEFAATDVVVVARRNDHDTRQAVEHADLGRVATVDRPGVVAAMRTGAASARGDVIAFLDDDAFAPPDWLARIAAHLSDRSVGGVGGRDVQPDAPPPDLSLAVGRISQWGRLTGNHHIGAGPARDVDVLKAVNMAFRREALALPVGLRGSGAEPHHEVATCRWATARGWRLVYDPALVVEHRPGPRFDADRRKDPEPKAIVDLAYNLVVALAVDATTSAVARRAAYGLVVGDRAVPGLLRAAVAGARREGTVAGRLIPSLRGQIAALRSISGGTGVRMVAVDTIDQRDAGSARPGGWS